MFGCTILGAFADLPAGTGPYTPTALSVAECLAHPCFPLAVLASARGAVELHLRGAVMSWLLGDRARALFAHRLVYLDSTRDPAEPRSGLLPTRVQADCVEMGLCSAGRAAAILALMRAGGYLAPGSETEDRRVRRLVATPRLWDLYRERIGRQLAAVSELSPAAARVAASLHEPTLATALLRHLNDYFVAGYRIMDYAPRLRLFAERSVGMMILFTLLIESADAGRFPLAGPVDLPIAELSRRFRVSRTHVLRLLRDAEAEGLLTRRGEGIVCAPELGAQLLALFAAIFHFIDQAAVAALAETGTG